MRGSIWTPPRRAATFRLIRLLVVSLVVAAVGVGVAMMQLGGLPSRAREKPAGAPSPSAAPTPAVTASARSTPTIYIPPQRRTPPLVTALSPATGPAKGGTRVRIVGRNYSAFGRVTAVRFGSRPAQFTILSDTQIVAVAPAGSRGTVDVVVVGPGGSGSGRFTYE